MTSNKYLELKKILFIAIASIFLGCKEEKKDILPISKTSKATTISYAKGFSVEKSALGLTIIKLCSPWPGAATSFTYALIPREKLSTITLNKDEYDAIITTPVERIIVTSTTHISALDALGVENTLVGFPKTALISSEKTRKRIDDGAVQELGNNENINTELVLSLNPDVVVGFGMNNQNKTYETLKRSMIPVVYNGDWTEESPLGKAEWIKFFAPFFHKEKEAEQLFKNIEASYNKTKKLALKASSKPTVLIGGLYKDVWHVAGGKSWMAQFLKDAQTNYLWKDTQETGGIAVSIESVLDIAEKADFWLNPSMLVSYDEMKLANRHYQKFEAFSTQKVYSNTISKGVTGGLLYYELAPQRPDLVLKDLIYIFHPELLPDHTLLFFKPLK